MKPLNQCLESHLHGDEDGIPQSLNTNDAAKSINRKPQTLRKWACLECGPIRPLRINGRLHWLVADLKMLLCGGVK